MRVVIVGGVAGGMSAATRLRRLDEKAEIIVLERGEHVSFANCGLPYHVSGVIPNREQLLLQTPESLGTRFRIDVRIRHEVTRIDRDAKQVEVTTPDGTELIDYDHLILAPGASPVIPPIPGIERALTLRNIRDMDELVAAVATKPRHAVVLGGGFIGVEVAENLHRLGVDVTIVELAPQVLPPLDEEMAAIVQAHLEDSGIAVVTSASATEVTPDEVRLDDGTLLPADLVVVSIGVRPDSGLAAEAGLAVGERGGIRVDESQRTSDPAIFAVGDAAEKRDVHTGEPVMVPLANAANRDGRLVADVIAGLEGPNGPRRSSRVTGTAVVGVLGLTAATTGWSERRARAEGLDVEVIHTHPFNHATYHPGAEVISLKLVIERGSQRILGAQAVGGAGTDKRIDVIATAIKGGLNAPDLAEIDLAYAPQFGSAKDPITMLGFVADNIRSGLIRMRQFHEIGALKAAGAHILDVRTEGEFSAGAIPGAVNIPLDELRERLSEVPTDREVVVYCGVGIRAHSAVQILRQAGIDVSNLDGGWRTWQAVQRVGMGS